MQNLRLKEAAYLFSAEAIFVKIFDNICNLDLGLADLLGARLKAAFRADVRARAVAQFEKPLMLEFGVGLGDGVVADDELFGQGADAGHLVAVLQNAGFDGVTDLLHELKVERLAGGCVESEDHKANCTTVLVQMTIGGRLIKRMQGFVRCFGRDDDC